MALLGDQYNIVATKPLGAARARAAGRGPQQWRQAAKQAGVDAVIEGWVQHEGRHHVLTVAVRDASTGNEIDTVTVKHRKQRRLDRIRATQLAAQLDDIFGCIDDDITSVRRRAPRHPHDAPDARRASRAAGDRRRR